MGEITQRFVVIDSMLRQMKDIVWIEIGVYKGVNAECALSRYSVARIYLIDPYVPLPYLKDYYGTKELVDAAKREAHARLERYEGKTVFLEDFSENVCGEIPDGSCTVLFIDGNHARRNVFADLTNFVPKIAVGGLVIGDDFNEPEVQRAISEYSQKHRVYYKGERVPGKASKFFFVRSDGSS